MDGSWVNFPKSLVITGGGFNKITIGSIKRKFEELESVCSVNPISSPLSKKDPSPWHSTGK
ncbi:hypothetical protein A2U01_0094062, partial [Trifolium medium]|nr:hypothetical protein [Trifolium medium]